MKNTVTCIKCGKDFDFEDDGVSTDCVPDGYILPDGSWICDDCGSCPHCGTCLEDHPLHVVETCNIKQRLEYLREEINNERISYGEIAELQSLKEYIDPGDVLLLEWVGVPENGEHDDTFCPEYNEPVLPDDDGNCSLCGAKLNPKEE